MAGDQQTQTVELDPMLAQAGYRGLRGAWDVQQGMLEQGLPSTYIGISDPRMQGLQQIEQMAGAGSMVPGAFLPEYQQTIGGGYLNANPYLDEIVQRSVSAAASPILGQAAGAGRYGSGIYANALADAAASTAANLYGANYQMERDRMLQMAGMTPMAYGMQFADAQQLMDVGAQYEQDQLNQQLEAMRQFMFPAEMSQWYNQIAAMSPLAGEREITTESPFNWLSMVSGILSPSLPGMGG